MKDQKGFTLIETLLYIGLFAIVIGGGLLATYGIIEGTNRNASEIAIAEDANFILRRIDWMLTGVDVAAGGIVTPASGSGSTLTVRKLGVGTPLSVALNSGNVEFNRGGGAEILNASVISISGLNFERIESAGLPDGIRATFTVSTNLSGNTVTKDFETTKYLRQ